jgi:hypothetical protein
VSSSSAAACSCHSMLEREFKSYGLKTTAIKFIIAFLCFLAAIRDLI